MIAYCKGGHQHNAWIRNGFWALVTEPSANPPLRCQPALPWGPGALGQCGPGWGRDSELHVQINPKQSGLEMPRFGRAADETSQHCCTAEHLGTVRSSVD